MLVYLQLAMEMADTIADYCIPGDLLDAAAHQYALGGDHAKAYAIGLRSSAAHQQTHSHQAPNRLID